MQNEVESGNLQMSVDGDVNSIYGHGDDAEYMNSIGSFIKKTAKKVGGKVKQAAKFTAKTAKKAVKLVKTGALAPVRGAFEAVVLLNGWGLASDLQKIKAAAADGKNKAAVDRWEKVKNVWLKMGGSRYTFSDFVTKGSKKKALKISFKKKKGADGSSFYYGVVKDPEYMNVVAIAASVATATPIILAVLKAMGKDPKDLEGMDPESITNLNEAGAEVESEINASTEALAKSGEIAKIEAAEAKGEKYEAGDIVDGKVVSAKMPMWKWAAIGGGVLVTIVGIALLLKTRK
jgi:hypothetical protein